MRIGKLTTDKIGDRMEEIQILDSIVGRLNFIMLKLLSMGSNLETEVLVSLAKEMLPEYGVEEEGEIRRMSSLIEEMCSFCDTIQKILQGVAGGEEDGQEALKKLSGKKIKVC